MATSEHGSRRAGDVGPSRRASEGRVAALVASSLGPRGADEVCPGSREHANRWAVLALAGTGGLMTSLDASIVNISLPSIARSFGVPLTGEVEWVINAYLVAIALVLLTVGRLSDMIGRKPIFVAGLVVFSPPAPSRGSAPR
jgi:hypothetical protein